MRPGGTDLGDGQGSGRRAAARRLRAGQPLAWAEVRRVATPLRGVAAGLGPGRGGLATPRSGGHHGPTARRAVGVGAEGLGGA